MRPISSSFLSIALLFQLTLAQQAASAADWQTIGRAASRASAQLDYQTAIHCYETAIARAESTRELDEITLDLKLCLADTLRRAGKLNDAVTILNSLESRISAQNLADPLLAARYWRRRAAMEGQLRSPQATSNALGHVCKITEKQLGAAGAEFELSWHRYMDSLVSWNLDEFIHQLKLTDELPCNQERRKELRSYGRTALVNHTHKALLDGKLELAERLLCAASVAEFCGAQTTVLWYRFVRQCQAYQKQDLITSAARELESQSKRLSQVEGKRGSGERLACHGALAYIYHVTGDPEQEDKQLELIAQLIPLIPLESFESAANLSLCCDSFNSVVTTARSQGVSMKRFEPLCLRLITLTQDIEPSAPLCCIRAYLLSRSTQCVLYMKSGELDRAKNILQSVDPRMIAALPALKALVPGLFSRLAVLYSNIGKDNEASECRNGASELSARIQSAKYKGSGAEQLGKVRAHPGSVGTNKQNHSRLENERVLNR